MKMIHKDKLKCVAVCDCCNNEIGPFDAFQDAIDELKARGWKAKKVEDGWDNICADCAECD